MNSYNELVIGSCPISEDCVQVGKDNNYGPVQREECKCFIEALRRMHGEEPKGARLHVTSNPHDFGTYYQVICRFNLDNRLAVEYAYKLESESPETWDEVGMTCPWQRDVQGNYSGSVDGSLNSPQPSTWGKWKNGKVQA